MTRVIAPREDRRPTNLSGWFIRDADQSIWDFRVADLSYGGCRLHTGANLRRGEEVRLSVQNRGIIDAIVRWRTGEIVGLAFKIAQQSRAPWPRKSQRHKAALEVLVRRPGRKSQWIDATDVSNHGCCVNFVDTPREGDRIWVQLPGLEALEGEVKWVEDYRAGVSFSKTIHPAVFELLLVRWTSKSC